MDTENGKDKKQENGVIFLMGAIDTSMASRICERIININSSNETKFIQLIINSVGGYCADGFAIIDIMEWSKVPVYTTGIGIIASMGLLIFASGEKKHRVLTPRTSILSHRYSSMAVGNYSQIVARRTEEDLMHQRIINHYIQHTNIKTEKDLNKLLLRDVDTWLTPEKAVKLGLADLVQDDIKNPYPNTKVNSIGGRV